MEQSVRPWGIPQAEIVRLAGAPLFEGMSDYSYPISSEEPYVQRYFDDGAFAFNHAESVRASDSPNSTQIARFALGEAPFWT